MRESVLREAANVARAPPPAKTVPEEYGPQLKKHHTDTGVLFTITPRDATSWTAGVGARPARYSFLYGHGACVNSAPSIQIVCPLMNDAPLLARKTTVGAMSAAVPTRPNGVSFDQVPA
jgi:hypothetical protein